jgi:rhamnosyltransferase
MKICAVVVTYFPDVVESINNIKRYINGVDHLIIWENTPENERVKYRITLQEYTERISYMSTGKNEGIAYALNRAVEYARENGYTHLLTMDQDSQWVDFKYFKSLAVTNEGVFSLACPNVSSRWKHETVSDAKACITSGSLFDLLIFERIGLFREDYFIDAVDTEFCYRIRKNNEKILVFGQTSLVQRFGEPTKVLGHSISNYSSFRTYYIVRNHLWLWREYPDIIDSNQKEWILKTNIIYRLVLILLFEKDKLPKLYRLMLGVKDGLFNRILQ